MEGGVHLRGAGAIVVDVTVLSAAVVGGVVGVLLVAGLCWCGFVRAAWQTMAEKNRLAAEVVKRLGVDFVPFLSVRFLIGVRVVSLQGASDFQTFVQLLLEMLRFVRANDEPLMTILQRGPVPERLCSRTMAAPPMGQLTPREYEGIVQAVVASLEESEELVTARPRHHDLWVGLGRGRRNLLLPAADDISARRKLYRVIFAKMAQSGLTQGGWEGRVVAFQFYEALKLRVPRFEKDGGSTVSIMVNRFKGDKESAVGVDGVEEVIGLLDPKVVVFRVVERETERLCVEHVDGGKLEVFSLEDMLRGKVVAKPQLTTLELPKLVVDMRVDRIVHAGWRETRVEYDITNVTPLWFKEELRSKYIAQHMETVFRGHTPRLQRDWVPVDVDGRMEGEKVLVVGKPGVGKTVWMRKVALDWAEGRGERDWDWVVLMQSSSVPRARRAALQSRQRVSNVHLWMEEHGDTMAEALMREGVPVRILPTVSFHLLTKLLHRIHSLPPSRVLFLLDGVSPHAADLAFLATFWKHRAADVILCSRPLQSPIPSYTPTSTLTITGFNPTSQEKILNNLTTVALNPRHPLPSTSSSSSFASRASIVTYVHRSPYLQRLVRTSPVILELFVWEIRTRGWEWFDNQTAFRVTPLFERAIQYLLEKWVTEHPAWGKHERTKPQVLAAWRSIRRLSTYLWRRPHGSDEPISGDEANEFLSSKLLGTIRRSGIDPSVPSDLESYPRLTDIEIEEILSNIGLFHPLPPPPPTLPTPSGKSMLYAIRHRRLLEYCVAVELGEEGVGEIGDDPSVWMFWVYVLSRRDDVPHTAVVSLVRSIASQVGKRGWTWEDFGILLVELPDGYLRGRHDRILPSDAPLDELITIAVEAQSWTLARYYAGFGSDSSAKVWEETITRGDVEGVKSLLKQNLSHTMPFPSTHHTPLSLATSLNHQPIIDLLLSQDGAVKEGGGE